MTRTADHFRPSDVTLWGIVALSCWGFAVLSANLSGLVPAEALAALHASRLEGGTVTQLRERVSGLEREAELLRRDNGMLLQRFDVAERAAGEVTRRVGAIETTLPALLERAAPQTLDRTSTGAVGAGGTLSFEAEGGTVSVQQKPLAPTAPQPVAAVIETPPASPTPAFGIALGFPVAPADTEAQWQSLAARVGTLLIGMAPRLAPVEGSEGLQLVAGPLDSRIAAEELCARMDRVGIPCTPAPYEGEHLKLPE